MIEAYVNRKTTKQVGRMHYIFKVNNKNVGIPIMDLNTALSYELLW